MSCLLHTRGTENLGKLGKSVSKESRGWRILEAREITMDLLMLKSSSQSGSTNLTTEDVSINNGKFDS